MSIKIRVAKCREDGHGHWLVTHDGNILAVAVNQPHATTYTDYWIRSSKEYKP